MLLHEGPRATFGAADYDVPTTHAGEKEVKLEVAESMNT